MLKDSFHVALIGSSGGGSATISSGIDIIGCIQQNLASIVCGRETGGASHSQLISITEIAFIQCQYGMDFINPREMNSATLIIMASGGSLEKKCTGTLDDVNDLLVVEDGRIANLILLGSIDAIISISSDPDGANKRTVAAAILKDIPFLGTGGTSLSSISTSGGNVIGGSGGSVATSAVTRGICIAASLAAHKPWGNMKYSIPTAPKLAKFRSVVGAALPILLSVSLLKASLPVCGHAIALITSYCQLVFNSELNKEPFKVPFMDALMVCLKSLHPFDDSSQSAGNFGSYFERSCHLWHTNLLDSLEQRVIPVVISSLSCLEVCNLQDLSLLSGAAAGAFISGNMICAYLAGSICGFLLPLLLVRCAQYSLLPTSTAILSVGVSATLSGVLASTLCGPITLITDLGPKIMFECACALSMLLFGSVCDGFTIFGGILGWMVSWGSEQGYYHVMMLPLIALQMDGGNFSVFGTLDSFCLCVPCAGVCFAVYLLSAYPISPRQVVTGENSSSMSCSSQITSPQTNEKTSPHPVVVGGYNHHLRQGLKGAISNFFMGDYVEACYPYTLHNRWVLLSVRISTAIAGGLMLGYLGLQADRIQLMPPTSCLAAYSGTTADYQLRSSAYLPLPLTILLATMRATSRKDDIPYDSCLNLAVDNIIPSENISLTRGITAKLSHLTGVGVLSGPVVIVIVVFMSFFLPFFTTLIFYSSKDLSKKMR